jgi:hypothetical protein
VIAVHDLSGASRRGLANLILLSGIKLAFVQSSPCKAHELRKMFGIANKQNEQRFAIIDTPLRN